MTIRDRLFGLGEIPFCDVTLVFRAEVIRASVDTGRRLPLLKITTCG